MKTEQQDTLLKTNEVAEILRLSPKTLRHYSSIGGGPLPVVRMGRSVRYRLSDVQAIIAGGADSLSLAQATKRGPGRPTKEETMNKRKEAV